MAQKTLRVIPLGGLGEIGKNMMALEYDRDIIVIDAGVLFPKSDMLGVDLVIPDTTYLQENHERVKGILITHGHEDHIGALPYVMRNLHVPIYAPKLAHGLIEVKLKEHHVYKNTELNMVEPGKPIKLGRFQIEFFRVCHSIPDAMGLAIETPLGMIVHTGDFKIDHTPVDGNPTDLAKLAKYGSKGVFLLLSDSTYAEVPGYTESEHVVGEALDRAIGEASGRVLIATFASLISRIQQIFSAASKHNRKVAIVGRSMVNNVQMAMEMGYIHPESGTLITLKEARTLAPQELIIITTGSQGEPTSALVRMANRKHHDIEVIPGDTVIISASPIPGNETVVSNTIDNLFRLGAQVLYHRIALVHVHGHGSQEELKLMINLLRPRFFVPVHGEYRHLVAHTKLAQSLGIPSDRTFVLEDGSILELKRGTAKVTGKVPAGHIYIDGRRTWDTGSDIIKERRLLAKDGIMVIITTLNSVSGKITNVRQIISSGFIEEPQTSLVYEQISTSIESAGLELDETSELSYITAKIKNIASNLLYNETGRRTLIIPVVLEE